MICGCGGAHCSASCYIFYINRNSASAIVAVSTASSTHVWHALSGCQCKFMYFDRPAIWNSIAVDCDAAVTCSRKPAFIAHSGCMPFTGVGLAYNFHSINPREIDLTCRLVWCTHANACQSIFLILYLFIFNHFYEWTATPTVIIHENWLLRAHISYILAHQTPTPHLWNHSRISLAALSDWILRDSMNEINKPKIDSIPCTHSKIIRVDEQAMEQQSRQFNTCDDVEQPAYKRRQSNVAWALIKCFVFQLTHRTFKMNRRLRSRDVWRRIRNRYK